MAVRNSQKKASNSIYQREDGRYEKRVYLGKGSDGKKKYRSIYGNTRREVLNKLNEEMKNQKKYETDIEDTVFRDYALYWMKKYKYPNLKPVSYDRLEQTYNTVCEYIGWVQMGNINTDDIQDMINDLSRKRAYSTVKKNYEFVNGVFKQTVNMGKLDFNPCVAVSMPRERNMAVQTKAIEILTQEETDAMYTFNEKIKKSNNQFYKHMPALLLMLNTGWRVGELLALEWEDINFKERNARINKTLAQAKPRDDDGEVTSNHKEMFPEKTKTRSGERITPLNDTAIELLRQIQRYNKRCKIKSNYVVCTKDGGYVTERNLLRTFKYVLGVINADRGYTIHSLRHTFASRMLTSGVDISIVSKLLGHSDINITYKKYIHILHGQLEASVMKMQKI